MSNLFEQLISGSSHSSPQPELLEALGKKAASQFLQNGDNLNESIVKLAAEYSNLNNEHIKRIAEFANNAVFQGLHSQNEDKNVHFPIANPGTIIQDLKDGGSPVHTGKTLSSPSFRDPNADYQLPPRNPPNTDGFADQASGMEELNRRNQVSGLSGTGEPVSKEASISWSNGNHANPVEDVFDTHIRLRAAKEKLASTHENFDLALKSAKEDFYQEVKHYVLDNDSDLRSVVNAVKLASPNDSFAFQVLRPVTERLVKEAAIKNADFRKSASQKIVNMRHPMMIAYAGIMKMAEEKIRSLAALNEVEMALHKTGSFLRKHAQ